MKFDDLEAALKRRSEDAPSDFELDRLVTGGLEPDEAEQVRVRAEADEHSAERLALLSAGRDAFPEFDGRPQLAAVRRRLAAQRGSLLSRLFRPTLWLASAAALAATALVVIPRLVDSDSASDTGLSGQVRAPGDTVRLKGGMKLEVVRKRGERAEKVVSGSSFHAGDALRFVVSLPRDGEVSVVGVEENGSLYVAWPLPAQEISTHRPAGDAQALPGAVELDAAVGREVLHLVLCPTGVTPRCKSRGNGQAPSCPEGCATTPFVVQKE